MLSADVLSSGDSVDKSDLSNYIIVPSLNIILRRTSRVPKQPTWMKYYDTPRKGKGIRYHLANYLSY